VDREDQGASGSEPDDDWAGDVEGDQLRGWISPDDRLWRHPSESGSSPVGTPTAPAAVAAVPRGRAGTWIVGGATACFVLALVAASLMITTTGGSDDDGASAVPSRSLSSAPTTEAGGGPVADRSTIPALVGSISHSTVALQVTGPTGTSLGAGLVAESGGIIVTTARALAGARSITVIEADGTRWPATLVGTDQDSGLAVVRIADDLPAATPDLDDPSTGTSAVAVSLDPAHRVGAAPTASVYAGTVTSAGRVSVGGLAAITVTAPLPRDDIGCPLIDGGGQVSGLLEAVERSGSSVVSVFMPAQLVFGVADQLVSSGQVEHGWLGAVLTDAPARAVTATTGVVGEVSADPPDGALLDVVDPGSPVAASGMHTGDVITAVDGARVDSAADLVTQLYSDPPGTTVEFEYDRQGSGPGYAWVTLADQSGDAPVFSSAP
jgi:putative serine protease PepD